MSCLAEQAKILFTEAEENNLSNNAMNERWGRWHTCGMCEQRYHGVVSCALGWACWKTYLDRPNTEPALRMAMSQLGNGLNGSRRYMDALSVREAELSMLQRIGGAGEHISRVQSNVAIAYAELGRLEEATWMQREVYSAYVRNYGEEHRDTFRGADNYATSLLALGRFEEGKSVLCKTIPVAQRVPGGSDAVTLKLWWSYASALCENARPTLDDLREAVDTFEEIRTDRAARARRRAPSCVAY